MVGIARKPELFTLMYTVISYQELHLKIQMLYSGAYDLTLDEKSVSLYLNPRSSDIYLCTCIFVWFVHCVPHLYAIYLLCTGLDQRTLTNQPVFAYIHQLEKILVCRCRAVKLCDDFVAV